MGNQHQSTTKKKSDAFIIQFNKRNIPNRNQPPTSSTDLTSSKRTIFISLIGLARTYKNCPPHVLYSSLLILPLKRKWICSSKYTDELEAASSGLLRNEDPSTKEFVELIKWKDSQGLVFWAKDDHETSSTQETLVHPFWQHISKHLVSLYDPITCGTYKPLQFVEDEQNADLLGELYFATLKFKSIKSILNHSNPKSFRVMTSYCESNITDNVFINMKMTDPDDTQSSDEWWVSTDYLRENA
eukprot:7267_1